MAESTSVRLIAWPVEPARAAHLFGAGAGAGVSLAFAASAARALVSTRIERPLALALQVRAAIRDTVPVCIGICEELCTWSDYMVQLSIFDHPVVSITVQGTTRLTRCE